PRRRGALMERWFGLLMIPLLGVIVVMGGRRWMATWRHTRGTGTMDDEWDPFAPGGGGRFDPTAGRPAGPGSDPRPEQSPPPASPPAPPPPRGPEDQPDWPPGGQWPEWPPQGR